LSLATDFIGTGDIGRPYRAVISKRSGLGLSSRRVASIFKYRDAEQELRGIAPLLRRPVSLFA
jgi:hypothetical protein